MTKTFKILLLSAIATAIAVPALGQALKGHNAKADVLISADRFEIQDRIDRATYSGNVVVHQGDLTLTASRLTIAYSSAGSGVDINRIDASGGVHVQSPSESARGDFAVYDLNRKIITVVGGVSLNQGRNQMTGGRLVLDLTSGRAVIDGGGGSASAASPDAPPGVTRDSGGRVTGRFTVSGKDK
jgi:lipopolysaccharide export system protein LptA